MGGVIFRFGERLKEWGERFRWGWLISLGLSIKEFIFQHGVIEDGKIKIR